MHVRTLVIVSDRKRRANRAMKDLIADHGLGLKGLNWRVLEDATARDADVDLICAVHFGFGYGLTNNRDKGMT